MAATARGLGRGSGGVAARPVGWCGEARRQMAWGRGLAGREFGEEPIGFVRARSTAVSLRNRRRRDPRTIDRGAVTLRTSAVGRATPACSADRHVRLPSRAHRLAMHALPSTDVGRASVDGLAGLTIRHVSSVVRVALAVRHLGSSIHHLVRSSRAFLAAARSCLAAVRSRHVPRGSHCLGRRAGAAFFRLNERDRVV